MVTAKDVANLAGISQPTVSAVLSGRARKLRISAKTEALVLATAERLGYKPNRIARALRQGHSSNIGILLPVPRENCYANFINEFERVLEDSGYSAIYGFWDTAEAAKKTVSHILAQQVDGILTVEPHLLPNALQIPVVTLFTPDERFDCVDVDWSDAFRQIVQYLKSMGHFRIAHPDCIPSANGGRFAAVFSEQLRKEGLETSYLTDLLQGTRLNFIGSNIERLAEWFMKHPKRPSAIVMPNDAGAVCLAGALQRRGIRIPQDLSIVGMDNITLSSWISPALTTFDFTTGEGLPALAARRLLDRLANPELPREQLLVHATMLVRASTGAAPKEE